MHMKEQLPQFQQRSKRTKHGRQRKPEYLREEVADAEHKVDGRGERLLVGDLSDYPVDSSALGHPDRPHLHRLAALHHVHRRVRNGARPQVLQHVPRLDAPELHIWTRKMEWF